jgi:hypothetical protein
MMGIYEVLLGIDRAARDTGRRITMQVRECADPLSAAIRAEALADKELANPGIEYTHAMRVRPLMETMPRPAVAMPLALAA